MSNLAPIATLVPMIHSTPETIIQPNYTPTLGTADATGSAAFSFNLIPPGQIWQGILICATAPDTAEFSPVSQSGGGDDLGSFKGANTWGPVQLVAGNQLTINATGLIPGVQYKMSFIGSTVTNGIPSVVQPAAYADSVTSSTEQIFLAGPLTSPAPVDVTIVPLWRSLWVVTSGGGVPTVVGDQSGIEYAPFTPPYLDTPAIFYRFPMVTGLDQSVTITFPAQTCWYGADLADIDSTVYTSSGGTPGIVVYYASLTGAGETSSPGELTQLGPFNITDTSNTSMTWSSNSTVTLTVDDYLNLAMTQPAATFDITSAGPLNITVAGNIPVTCNKLEVIAQSDIILSSQTQISLTTNGAGTGIFVGQSSDQVGFFGAAPVVQQAPPVTLADVIALLHLFGFTT